MIGVTSFMVVSFLLGYNEAQPIPQEAVNMNTGEDWSYALPFARALKIASPPIAGRDVMILQNLLKRHPGINLTATGTFNDHTKTALMTFQKDMKLKQSDGILNSASAIQILNHLMSDGYKDDGVIPDGAKFKLHVPVYRDRTIETIATLYAGDGTVLHKFTIRTRGSTGDKGQIVNQLTTNGNTPTGLSYMDVNSREPERLVKSFGPYPVLRVVKGIQGNSAIGRENFVAVDRRDTFLSNYRSGILVHTGIWDNWTKDKPMPNSNGCMHIAPDDQKLIIDLLVKRCGAIVNNNPFGKLPYPFKTQGVISVEQLD